MSQDSHNPFAIPGMNAAFMSSPNNPLLASMDMMRQAMGNMGNMGYGTKAATGESMPNPMAPEELEKRIAELRVVENWLKLNLSMLSSTIQGMEVQHATVKTLQSFVAMGQAGTTQTDSAASPLEVALGLKPAPKGKAAAPQPDPTPPASDASSAPSDASESPQQAAAQGWWNMLENQFAQIAAATATAAKANNEHLQKAAAMQQPKKPVASKAATKRTAKKTTRTTQAQKKSSS